MRTGSIGPRKPRTHLFGGWSDSRRQGAEPFIIAKAGQSRSVKRVLPLEHAAGGDDQTAGLLWPASNPPFRTIFDTMFQKNEIEKNVTTGRRGTKNK